MAERQVRFTDEFFSRLDLLLDEERDPAGTVENGLPRFEIPSIRDKLAADYEAATLATDDPLVRVYVGGGRLVAGVAVDVTLAPDGQCALSGSPSTRSPNPGHHLVGSNDRIRPTDVQQPLAGALSNHGILTTSPGSAGLRMAATMTQATR